MSQNLVWEYFRIILKIVTFLCLRTCLEPLQVRYPHQKCENFNTYHNFLIDYCRISLILNLCTRYWTTGPQVDSLVSIRPGSLLIIFFFFYEFLKNL